MPGGRILVIDDDSMVRNSVGKVLEDEGYAVDYGEDGPSALEKIVVNPPDAILLDLMMPGMNGRQFLAALRDDLCRDDIPVVVMTAVAGMDVHRAFAMGASDVVEKPFNVDELLNKVALALFRSREYETIPKQPVQARQLRRAAPEPVIDKPGVVLIVDDDRVTLRRLDALLSRRGYTVVSLARVTDELPRLARVLEPRAILLDLHLPDIDGMTALRTLRDDRQLDSIPILVFSTSVGDLEAARGEIGALGAAAAAKPMQDQELVDFVTTPPREALRRPPPNVV